MFTYRPAGAGGTATWWFRADSPPGRRQLHGDDAMHRRDGMAMEIDYRPV